MSKFMYAPLYVAFLYVTHDGTVAYANAVLDEPDILAKPIHGMEDLVRAKQHIMAANKTLADVIIMNWRRMEDKMTRH